jgi:quinol monooxygenase YgiN
MRLIVSFPIQPGKVEQFSAAWAQRLDECRAEPGCEQYELFRGVARPDMMVLLERWSTPEDLERHSALNKTRTPVGTEFLAGPVTIERYSS